MSVRRSDSFFEGGLRERGRTHFAGTDAVGFYLSEGFMKGNRP